MILGGPWQYPNKNYPAVLYGHDLGDGRISFLVPDHHVRTFFQADARLGVADVRVGEVVTVGAVVVDPQVP